MGISPSPETVKSIRDFPIPAKMRQLRQFLGLVNFYRRFFPHCAQVLLPLTGMFTNAKNCDIALSENAVTAFNILPERFDSWTTYSNSHRISGMSKEKTTPQQTPCHVE